jgi:proteasome-associated ATPase
MASRTPPDIDPSFLARITAVGDGAPGPDERLQLIALLRASSPEASGALDRHLLGEIGRLYGGLEHARENQAELKALLERLTAPPWHPAIFLGRAAAGNEPAAIVCHGNVRRIVRLNAGVDADDLALGDEVLLSHEMNVVIARSDAPTYRTGDTATFDRYTDDGRLVVTSRDEEIIVDAADTLARGTLKSGDLVRWDRAVGMAFEVIERSRGAEYFLEEAPSETFDDIGGLDSQIDELERAVLMRLRHGALVAKYGLRPKRSVLLWGPPGTGKTMLARALANRLRQLSPSGRARFMNIKPGSLHSMWYAESERNYREVFRVAREAGDRDPDIPVVIYFDEVDAIGAVRGAAVTRVDDRVLTAFMAELDGLESRGNVMVVASTNRRDVLDPGLTRPGRLGDAVIHVPQPGRKAARAILGKHLRPGIPYAQNGHGPDEAATREEILDAAAARLFASNGDSDLAVMMFRDGKQRTVKARDLVSGAVIAKIALAAMERACLREADSGESGVRLDDVVWAMDTEMASAARVLTPANCRAYLCDLPQDVDVVSVQPVERKVPRPERYLVHG